MNRFNYLDDNDNKRRGFWLSIFLHIAVLFFFLVPFMKKSETKTEQFQGIAVAMGDPDAYRVQKSVKASVSKPKAVTKPSAAVKKVAKTSKAVKSKVVSKNTVEESTVTAQKKLDEANERKRLEEERQKAIEREKALEEKRKQEEEKARKAAEKSKAKSRFSNMFKSGNESAEASKGSNNGKSGAEALDKLSRGSGKIGSGLGSRNVLHSPVIKDNTQKTGRVVINICVNSAGNVISAKFRQKGSTTTDAHLVSLAEKSAKKYIFSKSSIEEQCGDIVIDFKLR